MPRMRTAIVTLLLTFFAGIAHAQNVVVHAGDHDREQSVVRLNLDEQPGPGEVLMLTRVADDSRVPVQHDRKTKQVVWLLSKPLNAGQSRRYQLETIAAPKIKRETPAIVDQDDGILIAKVRERAVLQYNAKTQMPPEGIDEVFKRSGFIHPVYSPSGKVLTNDFPTSGHAHQHALFFAWTKTFLKKRQIDFWNQKKRTGTVQNQSVVKVESGQVFAQIHTKLGHIDLGRDEPQELIRDDWKTTVFATPKYNVFEITTTQNRTGKTPLVIAEYHYGGMAIRGNPSWDSAQSVQMTTSDGKDRIEGNHTRPRWVRMSGKIDGEPVGIAVFDHPGNFRHPQPVRLHPKFPYFCFSPMVLGEFKIEQGKPYRNTYRYVTFDGEMSLESLESMWQDFASPVVAEFEEQAVSQ